MRVLVDEGWAYVAITKTGTVATYTALENNFKTLKFKRGQLALPPQYEHYQTFTNVRNPYDRMISWWGSIVLPTGDRYGHKKELKNHNLSESFLDFIKLWTIKGVHPQTWFINHNKDTKLLRLENLEEDFNKLPFVKSFIKIPPMNVSKKVLSKEELSREELDLINSLWATDFETLGYERL